MKNKKERLAVNHISVDCVVIGFDGENLNVLLIKRTVEEEGNIYNDMKLPGSLIYMDEDLDEAASRVLKELTGLKTVKLHQFKTFGSKNRTDDPKDILWLERAMNSKVERIVTIGYISLIRINRDVNKILDKGMSLWVPIKDVKELAFDHNIIIQEALKYIQKYVNESPAALFDLLPTKFIASELRRLHEVIFNTEYDVRNFHKKMNSMPYVERLNEKQKDVPHRAAYYYRFNRSIYNKLRR
ncbi:MAG: NUDIX hydrolase [Bacteroidales bacterium]|nr:NUDIX hydrolase [Bacteroidales bacterium]